nr:MAG TPA_asm: hypothetical protein [Caudoviricetes sp.]
MKTLVPRIVRAFIWLVIFMFTGVLSGYPTLLIQVGRVMVLTHRN